jgi:hypothetical protein
MPFAYYNLASENGNNGSEAIHKFLGECILMKNYFTMILVCLVLFLMALGLGACGSRSEPSEVPSAGMEGVEDVPTVISETTDDAVLEATEASDEPTQEEETVAVAEEAENYCIDCHTSQQSLIDTAKPEDEVVSENEGEG